MQAAHLTMPLEKRFGKRLQRSTTEDTDTAAMPSAKQAHARKKAGECQSLPYTAFVHQFNSCMHDCFVYCASRTGVARLAARCQQQHLTSQAVVQDRGPCLLQQLCRHPLCILSQYVLLCWQQSLLCTIAGCEWLMAATDCMSCRCSKGREGTRQFR